MYVQMCYTYWQFACRTLYMLPKKIQLVYILFIPCFPTKKGRVGWKQEVVAAQVVVDAGTEEGKGKPGWMQELVQVVV